MDFKEWARDYGISQDFDLDDAAVMLEEYEKDRAKLSTNNAMPQCPHCGEPLAITAA